MSNRSANDDKAEEGSLARNAGWSDVWAGLLLTLFLLASAILVALLFSGRTSSLAQVDGFAVAHVKSLQGVRDPSRLRWRTADRPWDLMGTHEMMADIEDRGQAAEDRRRQEATTEISRGERVIPASLVVHASPPH
jgi:hypothetical protein